jgi:folate-binding protein YgfZ
MIYCLTDSHLRSSSAVLWVHGPDANSFLQGQFTQDLRLKIGESAYGLWLDQKGKVLADSHVLKQAENDFLVVSFSTSAAALRARLESYLIADEVELVDQSGEWEGILLWGADAPKLSPPADVRVLPSRRAGSGSIQWLVRADVLGSTQAGLTGVATPADRAAAERARLLAATPAIPHDIGPRDLPNEGNLEEVAISYTKGCYLGQEVMARLKNLGQVRRRLHLIRGTGPVPPAGTALFQGERKVGETRSAIEENGGFVGMAMLSLVNLDALAGLALAAPGKADVTIVQRV